MITLDFHSHNARCGHAQGQIEDYIKAALAKGLTEIGISDHSPIYWQEGNDPQPRGAMAKDELDAYVEEVIKLKAQYADRINVRLGLEADYVEDMEEFYRGIFAKYPFDYIIGSVHMVFGLHVYESSRWNTRPDALPIFAEYYRLVQKSARSGLYDILGHTSAIIAYAPKPITEAIHALQDEALEVIRETGVAIEINTSGYRKMTTDPFPTNRMVTKARDLGIPLTFGSDSHRPDEVANNREKVQTLLEQNGITELARFESRQRIMVPLLNPVTEISASH